jgi:G3E family GTPase
MVVVNDFGSINIDRDLIVASVGGTMSLSNGCVCCTMSGTMQQMLLGIGARPDPPEHVLIEASGVSDPAAIARDVDLPGFRLDAVVAVVDAETIEARLVHPYLGRTIRTQVAAADVVVVNKIDLVDEGRETSIRAALHGIAPTAAVVTTSEGRVSPAVLLGVHSEAPPSADSHDHESPHADHISWSWELDQPLDRTQIETWVASLADDIVRVKRLADLPAHAVVPPAGRAGALLYGGAGDNRLYGGTDNDVLVAGPGRDLLAGGAGDDRYILLAGMGTATVNELPLTGDDFGGAGGPPVDADGQPGRDVVELPAAVRLAGPGAARRPRQCAAVTLPKRRSM